MHVASRLASALDDRTEQPNIALAEELAASGDAKAIAELAALLQSGTRPERHDAIKVLYELGERRPGLIAPHLDGFISLLAGRDNRMLWGTLTALNALGDTLPEQLMPHLGVILDAADRSSVIAKDKTMHLLAKLNGDARFSAIVEPVLFDRLRHAAVNQFPMYAEFAAATVSDAARPGLITLIAARQAAISYPAKKARLEKLLRKLHRG